MSEPSALSPALPGSALLVDDDAIFRPRLAEALERRGVRCQQAADAAEALTLARAHPPELAVVDLRMPNGTGLELVRALRADGLTGVIFLLTGYGSIATAVEAMRCGANDYLTKPADAEQLMAAWRRANGAPRAPQPLTPPTLEQVEWEHIQRVLADCGGNVSQAARALGVHRRSLQRMLGRHPPA